MCARPFPFLENLGFFGCHHMPTVAADETIARVLVEDVLRLAFGAHGPRYSVIVYEHACTPTLVRLRNLADQRPSVSAPGSEGYKFCYAPPDGVRSV